MPAAVQSDYGFYRAIYRDKSVRHVHTAAATGTVDALIAPKNANYTIYVQRIMLAVTTDSAQSLTFQDGAGTPKVIGASAASPGLGIEIVGDYGPEGVALTLGEELDMVISGAGLAAIVTVEAYEKLGVVIAANSGSTLQ